MSGNLTCTCAVGAVKGRLGTTSVGLLLLGVFCSMVAGCSNGATGLQDQATPAALMAKYRQAIISGDEERFVACCWPRSPGCLAAQAASLQHLRSQIELKKALEDVSGAGAWAQFVAEGEKKSGLVFYTGVNMVEDDQWTPKVKQGPSGIYATCNGPSGEPLRLVRRKEKWYLDYTLEAMTDRFELVRSVETHAAAVTNDTARAVRAERLNPVEAYRRWREAYDPIPLYEAWENSRQSKPKQNPPRPGGIGFIE